MADKRNRRLQVTQKRFYTKTSSMRSGDFGFEGGEPGNEEAASWERVGEEA